MSRQADRFQFYEQYADQDTDRATTALPVRISPSSSHEVNHAKTGSSEKITAARVAVVRACPQVCTQKARAVAKTDVTPSAIITAGVQRNTTGSTNKNELRPMTAHDAIWTKASHSVPSFLEK